MKSPLLGPLTLHMQLDQFPLVKPFQICGYTWETREVLTVTLTSGGKAGRGEAAGVYYKGDDAAAIMQKIYALRTTIENGISRQSLQTLLPPGGARNAIDCALWDLEAKLTGCAAWAIAGLTELRPLMTTFTCGADLPATMAQDACNYRNACAIKLKLTGSSTDAERVRAVRAARPDVWLGVDANQGLTRASLEALMPVLLETHVSLIEQPFPVGQEVLLEGFQSPIPIAADESVQCLGDLRSMTGRFQIINIKLDKCGGLTEGLAMARAARALGLETMVGNMIGTSLAMAPAFLAGQLCSLVDLDGPVFLKADRPNPVQYKDGLLTCPETLWGNP